ncbi:MAG: GNAT family N-acetyltransferase [Xanthomonadales bacterium]|nr:GNAT family N-acetyltransferase [Xanthomonadales bacterium]
MSREASDRSTPSEHAPGHEGVSPTRLDWRLHAFDQFDVRQLYVVLAARVAVFVVEQDCPYQDLDGLDDLALHLVGWDDDGSVVAYARILPPGTRFEQPSIGRVLTSLDGRRSGLGRELMRRAIEVIGERYPGCPVRISAQCYLERFYCELGFAVDSAPYEEDGIPHVEMQLPASAAGS